jgi:Domain of unknown function (DUF5642)
MRLPTTLLALASATAIAACTSTPPPRAADIGKILSVKSTFGPDFKVQTIDKSAIDPKLLSPLQFQQGIKWEPPDCAQYAWTLPSGLKGNIASVSAEGAGNRFIAMALETSEPVPYDSTIVDKCRHVTFGGQNVRGVVDVIDAPHIDGVQTLGKHRELHTAAASGELYTYVAYLDTTLVVVTANPLLAPNQPVPPVNVQRAQRLLTDSVAAVRG